MIPRQQITRRADDDGVSAPVVERDYVLTHVVEGLALAPSHEGLVFKGGTALRLCFFNDFRYSADLDFSLTGIDEQHALDVVRQSLTETAERVGFTRLELVEVPPREIHYEGPLGRTRRIKVDLAADELVLDPTPKPAAAPLPGSIGSATIDHHVLVGRSRSRKAPLRHPASPVPRPARPPPPAR